MIFARTTERLVVGPSDVTLIYKKFKKSKMRKEKLQIVIFFYFSYFIFEFTKKSLHPPLGMQPCHARGFGHLASFKGNENC